MNVIIWIILIVGFIFLGIMNIKHKNNIKKAVEQSKIKRQHEAKEMLAAQARHEKRWAELDKKSDKTWTS